MTRRIALLLGLMIAFVLPIPAQVMTPAQTKLKAPGIFKDGTIVALDEKLKCSFDLKKDAISLEGSPSRQLDTDDAEMIRGFLNFFAVYARESVEWYEVEMSKERKAPLPPEKKKNDIATPYFRGVFVAAQNCIILMRPH